MTKREFVERFFLRCAPMLVQCPQGEDSIDLYDEVLEHADSAYAKICDAFPAPDTALGPKR